MPRAALINPSNYPLWLILHPTPTPSAEVASPIVAPEADGHGGETPKGGRCDIAVCDIARRREIVPGEPTGFLSFFFDLVSPLFSFSFSFSGVECDSFHPRPHAFFSFPLSDSAFQEHPSLAEAAAEGIMAAGAAVFRAVVVCFIISIQRCTNWVSHYVTLGYYVTLADAVSLE